ncbi:MAG TPA: MarR family transcriptional regulator [Paenirhodobacter sp.]
MADVRLNEQVGYLIARANRLLEEDLARRLQPGGIAVEQFRVIKSLEQEGSLSMGELADKVLVEPATLTKIIDRMTADNLVFRLPDSKDRRKVKVSLAPAGIAMSKKLFDVADAHEEHIAQILPTAELDEMKRILSDLKAR